MPKHHYAARMYLTAAFNGAAGGKQKVLCTQFRFTMQFETEYTENHHKHNTIEG